MRSFNIRGLKKEERRTSWRYKKVQRLCLLSAGHYDQKCNCHYYHFRVRKQVPWQWMFNI